MKIVLRDETEFEVTAAREELIRNVEPAPYWSMRLELGGDVSSDVITESFTPANISVFSLEAEESEHTFTGYSSVESASVIFDPLNGTSVAVVRIRK